MANEVTMETKVKIDYCLRQVAKREYPPVFVVEEYGGARWYFSCPFTTEGERCGERVLKLYLPPGERRFGCRECHELNYESSQHSHKYDGLYALLAGGEREGETYEFLKGAFSYMTREERRRRAQGQAGWLEDFESYFGEDLQRTP